MPIVATCVITIILVIALQPNGTMYEGRVLILNPNFDIQNLNFENHTVLATLTVELQGVQNITINGTPKLPDIICIQTSNSHNDEFNLTLSKDYGNGTYSYNGTLEDRNWYLYNMGEGYPYDVNAIEFTVLNLDFIIGDVRYDATKLDNYTLQMKNVQSQFMGLNSLDLKNSWKIENKPNGGVLDILFARGDITSTFIIITPLSWLLTLIAVAPTFTKGRRTKIAIYSSILVFSPMFLFAIQTLIPQRSTPSIAEFLTVTLMLLSASFLITTLPKYKKKISMISDLAVFVIIASLIGYIYPLIFCRLLSWWQPVQWTFIGLEGLLVVGFIFRIVHDYYESNQWYNKSLDY